MNSKHKTINARTFMRSMAAEADEDNMSDDVKSLFQASVPEAVQALLKVAETSPSRRTARDAAQTLLRYRRRLTDDVIARAEKALERFKG